MRSDPTHILWKVDLIIIESSINDIQELDYSKYSKDKDKGILITNELLIREILSTFSQSLLLYYEASWRDWNVQSTITTIS